MREISGEEIKKRKGEVCNGCKHQLTYHIFWNHDGSFLELTNCNECACKKFVKKGVGE